MSTASDTGAAVVFDLDGVLIDSEGVWDQVRRDLAAEAGRQWPETATADMMGMSSLEWSAYMHEAVGLADPPATINGDVVARIISRYEASLPLVPGAVSAVRRMAERHPLGLASSSNREVIDVVMAASGLAECFAVTVSSEEVGAGKPAPDVYVEAAARLGVDPARCVAVEDSGNGIRSAVAAGMAVIAIPNREFPPDDTTLSLAAARIASIAALEPALVRSLAVG